MPRKGTVIRTGFKMKGWQGQVDDFAGSLCELE
jgi:hypothetical protein